MASQLAFLAALLPVVPLVAGHGHVLASSPTASGTQAGTPNWNTSARCLRPRLAMRQPRQRLHRPRRLCQHRHHLPQIRHKRASIRDSRDRQPSDVPMEHLAHQPQGPGHRLYRQLRDRLRDRRQNDAEVGQDGRWGLDLGLGLGTTRRHIRSV